MRRFLSAGRSPSPQQQRPTPQQEIQSSPHFQMHQQTQHGQHGQFQTQQRPNIGAPPPAASASFGYAENTPPKPPSSQVKSPTTPRQPYAIVVPIDSPGGGTPSSKESSQQRMSFPSSTVATGNQGSAQKPLIPFGNSSAANRMSPVGPTSHRPQAPALHAAHSSPQVQTPRSQQPAPQQHQHQQHNSVPCTFRPDMGQPNLASSRQHLIPQGHNSNPLSPTPGHNMTIPSNNEVSVPPTAASFSAHLSSSPSQYPIAAPLAQKLSPGESHVRVLERLQASDMEVKKLSEELERLRAMALDEDRIEKNRAELREELRAAEDVIRGQQGREQHIIQLQSALISAENNGYMQKQRVAELAGQLAEKDAKAQDELEAVRDLCQADVRRMEEMLNDVCSELDVVKEGAKGMQGENKRLRGALAEMEARQKEAVSGELEGRVRHLEARVVDLEHLLRCEQVERARAEGQALKMRAFAEAKQKEAEDANFSALAAVRETEELADQIRLQAASTPRPHAPSHDPAQRPPASTSSRALIPGTHPSWANSHALPPPSSPSPPPIDVSSHSTFWPFSAISPSSVTHTGSLSLTPPPPPRCLAWDDAAGGRTLLSSDTSTSPLPEPTHRLRGVATAHPAVVPKHSFRLFEVDSGGRPAAALDVEHGSSWEHFCSACSVAVGGYISHFRYNDEGTQRFGLECRGEEDWKVLLRAINGARAPKQLLVIRKPAGGVVRLHGEVQC